MCSLVKFSPLINQSFRSFSARSKSDLSAISWIYLLLLDIKSEKMFFFFFFWMSCFVFSDVS